VLVPGGWHGGWAYDAVAERLRGRGHAVHAVTVRGLEPEPDPAASPNLDDHVAQVVEVVAGCAGPVVLAGHSYGGLVVAGAADRVPERIAHLVFLDAYVPDDGDSCWSLTSDRFRTLFVAGSARDGRTVDPPPRGDPRRRPHPLPTFLQAVRLSGGTPPYPRSFVYGGHWRGSPFPPLADRLRVDPGWTVHDLPVGHDVMNRAPDDVAALLDAAAR
jgi:pimeloyl-ACP methyl ester carboxylesterase